MPLLRRNLENLRALDWKKWARWLISSRNGVLTLVMLIGYGLLGVAIFLNFPPAWFYLPQSQRNPGSCSALGDCTNPDVVRAFMFFLPLSPILFMKFEDAQWTYFVRGTEKQFGQVLWLIGAVGVSSSGLELATSLAQANFQVFVAGLLALTSLPFLKWIRKHSQYVRQKEYLSLSPAEFLILGFVYVTLVPLSGSYFFGSILNVALLDFGLLLVGSPAFTHFIRIKISMNWVEESRYGL